MELLSEKIGKYRIIKAKGRLDSSWAEYFTDTFINYIRNGDHQLIIDASAMEFLSSAGIRSFVRINRELTLVNGSFVIVKANDFVSKTLSTTGFGSWMSDTLPEEIQAPATGASTESSGNFETFIIDQQGILEFKSADAWQPWNVVDRTKMMSLSFPRNMYGLGVGSPVTGLEKAESRFGEFLVICGNLVYMAPEEKGRPDYLLPASEYIPEMLVIQALTCSGKMSRLLRFSPTDGQPEISLSKLVGKVLTITDSPAAGFVVAAEAGGIVGASLIRSPGMVDNKTESGYTEIKEWLSYCGERAFSGEQVVAFGIVARTAECANNRLLKPLPSDPELCAHVHATIFPYQPLPNGNIDIIKQIDKFFNGPPPIALLHLIDDNRPAQGLGESSFIRGACWCAPLKNREDLS